MLDQNVITRSPGELTYEKTGGISVPEALLTPGLEVRSAYIVESNSVTESALEASAQMATIVCGKLDKGSRMSVLTSQALYQCSPDDTHGKGVTIVAYRNDGEKPENVAFKYDRVQDPKAHLTSKAVWTQIKVNEGFAPEQVVIWDPPEEAERWADTKGLTRKDQKTGRTCIVISEMY